MLVDKAVVKGAIIVVDNPHLPPDGFGFNVLFVYNPTTVKISTKANWKNESQKGALTEPQYTGPSPRTISFDLLLGDILPDSGVDSPKVALDIAFLVGLTRPTKLSILTKKPRPPEVLLEWGIATWANYRMYVDSVNAEIIRFAASGLPEMAKVGITLVELPRELIPINPTSHSRAGQQSHELSYGESLASVAFKYYKRPTLWRGLAELNGIDDPTRVRAGQLLFIPPLDDVVAASI